MGLVVFVILILSLIASNIRSLVIVKTTDDVSEESEDYFDDFETL